MIFFFQVPIIFFFLSVFLSTPIPTPSPLQVTLPFKPTHLGHCRPSTGRPSPSPPDPSRCAVSLSRCRRRGRRRRVLFGGRRPLLSVAVVPFVRRGKSCPGTRDTGTRCGQAAPAARTGRPRPPGARAWRTAAAGHRRTASSRVRCPRTGGSGARCPRSPSSPSARHGPRPATGRRLPRGRRRLVTVTVVPPSGSARRAGRG